MNRLHIHEPISDMMSRRLSRDEAISGRSMLSFDDVRWTELQGGYRLKYDPRPALARLRSGNPAAWEELWNELHHQGDVGTASYAAVPHLVDIHRCRNVPEWQTYGLIGVIEICRVQGRGPKIPDWMRDSYQSALAEVLELGCRDLRRTSDEDTVRAILGAIAVAKGATHLGDIMLRFSADELEEMIQGYNGGGN